MKPDHYSMYIEYADFLFNKMKSIPLALKYLAVIENRYLSLVDKFRYYRLKQAIIKYNH